ncbi:MAG: hypothetical protein JRF61_20265 [Deltaproteobacteria bacterium]|jgi:hypothetical protein|nr:hypothetical protein [Deltaproteobacteria bacterium]
MSEAVDNAGDAGRTDPAPGKARLEIRKGADSALDLAGLRFVACRREIAGIDGGVTLYLRDTVEGEERDLLRFDFFRQKPHYHVPAENASERAIEAEGYESGLAWGLGEITTQTKVLLEEAGHGKVAARVDGDALEQAESRLRSLISGLAEPTETSYFEVDAALLEGLQAN